MSSTLCGLLQHSKPEAPKILSTPEARSQWLVENSTHQGVASTAWAFESTDMKKKLNIQDVTNLCCAIVVAGRVNESKVMLQKLWQNSIELLDLDAVFVDESFLQLAQMQVFASARYCACVLAECGGCG